MAEYASKGVAGTGLGLGIAGTALGLLNGNGCNGGVLGNLLGGNCCNKGAGAQLQYVSSLQAQNAMLKSQNYADKVAKQVYGQSLLDNRNLRTELYSFIKPLADESANNRVEVAVLKAQIEKDKEITALKIQNCCCEVNTNVVRLADQLGNLQNTMCKITQTIIPASAICPQPMPKYNSFTTPTGTPTSVEVSGTVNTRTAACA